MSARSPSLPFGAGSVMASRQVDPGTLDYFPTPPWAARAGGELVRALDPEAKTCWEPACGEGHMAHGLAEYFPDVWASDVHDYGGAFWTENPLHPGVTWPAVSDFLGEGPKPGQPIDWIISNPPFIDGEAFIRLAWARAQRGVAMLLRLAFIESAARYRLFEEVPLTVLAPFSERVPMVKGRWDPEASSATAYAWFICARAIVTPPAAEPVVRLIPPGTKARLSRESDLSLFATKASAPLLAGAADA